MEQPLISVIVPVYKVEAYLDVCVSSIVSQTYRNLEIILVDDGSPDNCPAMCDAWAERDARIRVIHQINQGGGAARNAGLDAAKGDLIAFVDSDDYIAPEMYSYLYNLLKCGADIAECEYAEVTDSAAPFTTEGDTQEYTVREAMREHIQDRRFRQLIWNKLYDRKTVGDIRFPTHKGIDDEFFTYRVLGNAQRLIHSSRVCYAYRQQQDSIMHTISPAMRLQAVEAKRERHDYIRRRFPELTEPSARVLWFTCLYQGQRAIKEQDRRAAQQTMAMLKNVLAENPVNRKECSMKERLWLGLAGKNLPAACRVRNALKIGI